MHQNSTDKGNRRFISIQIQEPLKTPEPTFDSIFGMSLERLTNVAAELNNELNVTDTGYRVMKIDTTNMTDVRRAADSLDQLTLDSLEESIKPSRTNEDLLFQVILDWGLELTMPIHSETIDGHEILSVDDDALIACFDREVTLRVVREMAHRQPLRAVFRDDGFPNDAARINAEQIFREVSPSTDVKAI